MSSMQCCQCNGPTKYGSDCQCEECGADVRLCGKCVRTMCAEITVPALCETCKDKKPKLKVKKAKESVKVDKDPLELEADLRALHRDSSQDSDEDDSEKAESSSADEAEEAPSTKVPASAGSSSDNPPVAEGFVRVQVEYKKFDMKLNATVGTPVRTIPKTKAPAATFDISPTLKPCPLYTFYPAH